MLRTVRTLFITLALVLGPTAGASAQGEAPQACGQQAETADYGDLEVGELVVPQRHRFVGGDPNWDARQARFIGRPTRITRLSGVDERGCPGVRLAVDGGRWFYRVRDLNVGARHPTRVARAARSSSVPQGCGRTDANVSYGPFRVGTQVVLGRHRPVAGDDNWSSEMSPFVGRTGRIVQHAGTDEQGCPGVNVDADAREWFWRVRDLRPADGESPVAFRPGLASDHGRPDTGDATAASPDPRIPQACGGTDENADYGPVAVGTTVVLGRHSAVSGETNWVPEMAAFVGREGRVIELIGVDEQGCALIHVDIDEGEWFWRLRDARLPAAASASQPDVEPAAPESPSVSRDDRPRSGAR